MKFLRLSILFGCLLVSDQTFAADDDDEPVVVASTIATSFNSTKPQDDQSVEIDWQVPVAKWRTTPRWNPETEPVPLDAEGAAKAAKRWIAKQPWADQFESFTSIALVCWGDPASPSPVTGLWYYKLDFHMKKTLEDKSSPQPASTPKPQLDLRPTTVVVLFDGTVIEPMVSKPVRRGDKE